METLNGILRALLATGAGYLVGKGVIDAGMADQLTGAALTLITIAWSVLAKSDKFPKIK